MKDDNLSGWIIFILITFVVWYITTHLSQAIEIESLGKQFGNWNVDAPIAYPCRVAYMPGGSVGWSGSCDIKKVLKENEKRMKKETGPKKKEDKNETKD